MKPEITFKNNAGAFYHQEEVDDFTFFQRVVGVFSSSFLEKDYHLTERELELLYCIYNFKANGSGDVFSKSNINEFFAPFGSKRLLQVWLPKLSDKLWIRSTKNSVDFTQPKLVEFLNSDKIQFNILYKRKKIGEF